ncbi:fumarylacetoacetate hydrolase family protein [Cellulomonas xiejunii]|uniref:Fumarylacetoacetate hydrolase family protein n=1 Tax=Cellulomonas xiejunii TaxID=2968083 RepID=A0ABY5KUL4_9CELL|nr:fumarylacetoacetate hydrolase family protein [Cellulomonas xiejunii]MCC2321448.1 fumarylacetoacetate hydrolase family protein [Cellulomonas xiejunii]MCC2323400.1 fumarylacetoacetate hydrolase family protein [Cellulomonas xiejunii]UUI72023.1 fumarylacetoacetate hydrolase family protein [Cellulomonas xiejunii]
MRLVRFSTSRAAGVRHGVLDGARVVPVAGLTDPAPTGAAVPLTDVRLHAPVQPRTVVGMAHNTGPGDRRLPPGAFYKPASSVIGPGDVVELPDVGRVDAEAEIALVVGRRSRDLGPDDVRGAVLGWTCADDVTARDLQAHDDSWVRAKGYDTFTPLGPWIETDPAFDPDDAVVALDGIAAGTHGLARTATEVLVWLTSFVTLDVGDVVLLGAPGPSRPLADGDTARVRVAGLGELVNPVRARVPAVAR